VVLSIDWQCTAAKSSRKGWLHICSIAALHVSLWHHKFSTHLGFRSFYFRDTQSIRENALAKHFFFPILFFKLVVNSWYVCEEGYGTRSVCTRFLYVQNAATLSFLYAFQGMDFAENILFIRYGLSQKSAIRFFFDQKYTNGSLHLNLVIFKRENLHVATTLI
jgi:hypothetical protein